MDRGLAVGEWGKWIGGLAVGDQIKWIGGLVGGEWGK